MANLITEAFGAVKGLVMRNPVAAVGIGAAALILPRLLGAGQSPEAMAGAQQSVGGQIPQGGVPPPSSSGSGYV